MSKEKKKSGNYDADSIVQLDYPENVRAKVGMYLGGDGRIGNNQAIYEIISNAIDEFLAGHCSEIYVKLNTKENSIIICDNGRGMPVGINAKTGKPAIEMIVASLHAGGKHDAKNYGSSGGVNGVGASASNAVSSLFQVQTFGGGKWHQIEYSKGIKKKPLFTIKPEARWVKAFKTGTQVKLILDDTIFKKEFKIDAEYVENTLIDLSYICNGLKIHFDLNNKVETYLEKEGEISYVLDTLESNIEDDSNIKSLQGKKPFVYKDKDFTVSLLWTTSHAEEWYAYTNCIYNEEGGTHVTAVSNTIDKTFKKVFDSSYKGGVLRQGLIGFISVKATNDKVQYKGQNKSLMIGEGVSKIINDSALAKSLEDWARNTPAAKMINSYANSRTKASASMDKEMAKQLNELEKDIKDANKRKFTICDKLVDAHGCKPNEREIFIVEGDSAKGGIIPARDKRYQAILCLKGKFTNVYKADKGAFSNEDIKNIFTVLGISPNEKDMLKKVRAARIIIATDEDVDGLHITDLLIGLFTRYMPDIIDAGMLYKAKSPLFSLTDSKGIKYYALTEKEKQKHIENIKGKPTITRFKGLGEASSEVMARFMMNPGTRKIYQLIRGGKSTSTVEKVMGEDTVHRKQILGIIDREMIEVA